MKNKFTLRLRLTVVTSLILIVTCAVFTWFSIMNAENTIYNALATTPAFLETEAAPLQDALPDDSLPQMAAGLTEASQVHTRHFSELTLWFMGGAIVLGSLIMYVASGVILRPLKQLSSTISTIDKEGLDIRINGYCSEDELNVLADSFNMMMERLHCAFKRERRFSTNAAHELKTPLAVMKTNIEVLDETSALEDYRQMLPILRRQTDRMSVLIRQLMEFSSMSLSTFSQMVELDKLVDSVAQECCSENVRINLKSCVVKGDSVLLKQAVTNLVQNAEKYGDGTVEVVTEEIDDFVYVRIKDYGIGVPEEEREKIFEPFYRGDKSRSRASGGNGLGLSIVSEIVRIHGGDIGCYANEKDGSLLGSVFTITLPKYKQ